MLNLRDQRVVVWANDHKKPELVGTLPPEAGAPEDRGAFLAFGRWLSPRSAASLDHAIMALREKSVGFDLIVEAASGAPLEVQGRKTAQHVVVRFLSLTETQRSNARLKLENRRLLGDYETLLGLIDSLKMPFWMRGVDGSLKWVNRAYAAAVEAESASLALRDGKEFLGTQARDAIAQHHTSKPVFEQTLSTVIKGDRRMFAVADFAALDGSAGIATDVSDIESMREEQQRTIQSHANTLDRLTTAVAIFDPTRSSASSTRPSRSCGTSNTGFSTARPTMRCCSTGCAATARSPNSRNGGAGRRTCSPSIARPTRRSIGGICPTAAPFASSPIRSPMAASPGCSRT